MLGESGTHVGSGTVAVVGQDLDDDGDATRPIALVADLVIGFAVPALRLLDGPLDTVLGHVFGACRNHRRPQAGIHGGAGECPTGSAPEPSLAATEKVCIFWRPAAPSVEGCFLTGNPTQLF